MKFKRIYYKLFINKINSLEQYQLFFICYIKQEFINQKKKFSLLKLQHLQITELILNKYKLI